jgi:ketosteroid isomerase-like protein
VTDPGTATAAVVRAAYGAVERGDTAGLFDLIAPEAVWFVPGTSPLSGAHRGHDRIRAFLVGLRERSQGSLRVQLQDLAVGERVAVAVQRVTAERSGRSLDVSMCVVYRAAEGLLTEARYFVDDQGQYDAFWS